MKKKTQTYFKTFVIIKSVTTVLNVSSINTINRRHLKIKYQLVQDQYFVHKR